MQENAWSPDAYQHTTHRMPRHPEAINLLENRSYPHHPASTPLHAMCAAARARFTRRPVRAGGAVEGIRTRRARDSLYP